MKRLFTFNLCLFFAASALAQTQEIKTQSIKLFIGADSLKNPDLTAEQLARVKSKLVLLVNNSGVAEVGYSNFLVSPTLYVIEETKTEGLMQNFTVVKCELTIFISRVQTSHRIATVAAHLASQSIKLSGNGTNKNAAINNAINQLSPSNKELNTFIINSKIKISEYYATHCNDILKEARQASDLQEYGQAISLYFSIPQNAPCYEKARKESVEVYRAYKNEECKSLLLELKGLIAITPNTADSSFQHRYEDALIVITQMDPTTDCYNEALKEMNKIENRLDEAQKREWEMQKLKEKNDTDIQKEMFKAIAKISSQQTMIIK